MNDQVMRSKVCKNSEEQINWECQSSNLPKDKEIGVLHDKALPPSLVDVIPFLESEWISPDTSYEVLFLSYHHTPAHLFKSQSFEVNFSGSRPKVVNSFLQVLVIVFQIQLFRKRSFLVKRKVSDRQIYCTLKCKFRLLFQSLLLSFLWLRFATRRTWTLFRNFKLLLLVVLFNGLTIIPLL